MAKVITINNLWKIYRLGVIGHGTIVQDFQSWLAKLRGIEDPNSMIEPFSNGMQVQVEGNQFVALRDIDLDIAAGEVVGIIGKNGAGKSTLLKILSRITKPTRGFARMKGRLASLLEVGTGFHPELTGKENIFLNGAILGMTRQEISGKIDEIINFSGVEQYISTPVKRYSSGMRVRLAFAVAAHLEADILLIDEVLAVGDAEFQKKAVGKMKEITQEQKRTILFVSHNMAAVGKLCNRVCVLNNGRLEFDGDTPKGIQYYLNKVISSDPLKPKRKYDYDLNKPFQFTGCWVENGSGEKISTIQSGQCLTLVLSYRSRLKIDTSIYITVNIYSEDNVALITLSNRLVSTEKLKLKDSGVFKFVINKFPLTTGIYTYHIKAAGFGIGSLDIVENADVLNVIKGDFFGSGKITKSYSRGVLVDHQFVAE